MLLRQRPIVKLSLIENPPLTPAGRFLALALAVLVISGTFAGSAFGKNAEEKLDAVEEKIDTTRQREGVLTRDIESMGNEISALESQVADLRSQEDAAEAELAAKQAELDQAVSQRKSLLAS